MIIYKITNMLNGKMYIGQTVQSLIDRWSDHSRPSLGKHLNRSAIACAIRKHGKENFKIEQIDSAGTLEALNLLEIHYIKKFNTLSPNGYNLELGGDNKLCHPETKAKISATLKGRPIKNRMNGAPKGRPVTQERRDRISASLKGKAVPSKYKAVIDSNGKVYESVNATAKSLNANRVTISALIKSGKIGRLGLSFKFYLPKA